MVGVPTKGGSWGRKGSMPRLGVFRDLVTLSYVPPKELVGSHRVSQQSKSGTLASY